MSDARALWEACASALRMEVSDAVWQTTFNLVTPVEFDGRQLRLAVPNLLVKERFEGRFRSLVTDALETAGWPDVEVSVQVSAASAAIDNVVDLAPVGAWTGPRQLTFEQASEPPVVERPVVEEGEIGRAHV